MTYVLERRAETSRTIQMLQGNMTKVLRKIVGKTKIHRTRSQQIREYCGFQPIN
jgi:hypothetical protein